MLCIDTATATIYNGFKITKAQIEQKPIKYMEKNGTPYTDEQWQRWYAHKSNKERWIEEQEARESEE